MALGKSSTGWEPQKKRLSQESSNGTCWRVTAIAIGSPEIISRYEQTLREEKLRIRRHCIGLFLLFDSKCLVFL